MVNGNTEKILFLSKITAGLSLLDIKNLCSKYGKVVACTFSGKHMHSFVEFSSKKMARFALQRLSYVTKGDIIKLCDKTQNYFDLKSKPFMIQLSRLTSPLITKEAKVLVITFNNPNDNIVCNDILELFSGIGKVTTISITESQYYFNSTVLVEMSTIKEAKTAYEMLNNSYAWGQTLVFVKYSGKSTISLHYPRNTDKYFSIYNSIESSTTFCDSSKQLKTEDKIDHNNSQVTPDSSIFEISNESFRGNEFFNKGNSSNTGNDKKYEIYVSANTHKSPKDDLAKKEISGRNNDYRDTQANKDFEGNHLNQRSSKSERSDCYGDNGFYSPCNDVSNSLNNSNNFCVGLITNGNTDGVSNSPRYVACNMNPFDNNVITSTTTRSQSGSSVANSLGINKLKENMNESVTKTKDNKQVSECSDMCGDTTPSCRKQSNDQTSSIFVHSRGISTNSCITSSITDIDDPDGQNFSPRAINNYRSNSEHSISIDPLAPAVNVNDIPKLCSTLFISNFKVQTTNSYKNRTKRDYSDYDSIVNNFTNSVSREHPGEDETNGVNEGNIDHNFTNEGQNSNSVIFEKNKSDVYMGNPNQNTGKYEHQNLSNRLGSPRFNQESKSGKYEKTKEGGSSGYGENRRKCVILVSNLPTSGISPYSIANLFLQYGQVTSVKVIREKQSRALVQLMNNDQAIRCLKMLNGLIFFGVKLSVVLSHYDVITGNPDDQTHIALTRQSPIFIFKSPSNFPSAKLECSIMNSEDFQRWGDGGCRHWGSRRGNGNGNSADIQKLWSVLSTENGLGTMKKLMLTSSNIKESDIRRISCIYKDIDTTLLMKSVMDVTRGSLVTVSPIDDVSQYPEGFCSNIDELPMRCRCIIEFTSSDIAARCVAFNSSKHVFSGTFYVSFKFI